jgi:hypothetical protein
MTQTLYMDQKPDYAPLTATKGTLVTHRAASSEGAKRKRPVDTCRRHMHADGHA